MPRGLLKPVILSLLSDRPRHGFEIMEETSVRTGGMWRPGPGEVYPALLWLEERGHVEVQAGGERARKPYAITDKGLAAIDNLDDLLEDWETTMDRPEAIWRPPEGAVAR
ncbi:MAG: PadR family transcriptional regulator [Candidatus Thermoplasmatota archaeon]|nr:PadR family transcriptional regulator [Candidatus Thermoplasmatota archaeon]